MARTKEKTISSLSAQFNAVAFDIWGVLWDGQTFFPGAQDELKALRAQGKKVVLLSNTTQIGDAAAEHYAAHGLKQDEHYDFLITAGDITRDKLLRRDFHDISLPQTGGKYYNVGGPHPDMFEGTGITETTDIKEADFIYLGMTYKNGVRQKSADAFLPELQECLAHGKPVLCANPDYYAQSGSEYFACQGLIAKAYEDMGGVVEWCGKPAVSIFEACVQRLGIEDRKTICMVGDTLRTDIKGAKNAGIPSVLVTETGVTAEAVKAGQKIEDICQKEGVTPDHVIGRVGKKTPGAVNP